MNSDFQKVEFQLSLKSSFVDIDFKQFVVLVDKLAGKLLSNGLQENDTVAIYSENSVEYIVYLFALLKLGNRIVFLNTRLSVSDLNYQCEFAKIRVVFSSKSLLSNCSSFSVNSTLMMSIDEITSYKSCNLITSESFKKVREDSSFVIFTSGSTGKPKAAILTELNFIESGKEFLNYYNFDSKDIYYLSVPLFRVGGLGALFRMFVSGGTVYLSNSLATDSLSKGIIENDISCLSIVPSQLHGLINSGDQVLERMRKMKAILIGGAKIEPALLRRIKEEDLSVYVPYGITEASSSVTSGKLLVDENVLATGRYSNGTTLGHLKVEIVDTETFLPLPANEVGLVKMTGKALFKGYLNEQGQVEGITNFMPGDLAYFDENNRLFLQGRKDRVFKSGGFRVSPEELELVLGNYPGIDSVVIVPTKHEKWGDVPLALIKSDGENLNTFEIQAYLKKHLANYKVPKTWIQVDNFQLLGSGKVDMQYLKNKSHTTNMYYRTLGDRSNPCLILLHGTFGSGSDWLECAESLKDKYYVILPDLPGSANSAKEQFFDSLSFDLINKELEALVSDINPNKLFIAGYSFGARVALNFYLNTNQKIDGLFFEGLNPGINDPKQKEERKVKDNALAKKIKEQDLAEFFKFWYSLPLFGLDDNLELLEKTVNSKLNLDRRWAAQSLLKLSVAEMPYLQDQIKNVECPICLITGSRDKKFTNFASEIADDFPNLWKSISLDSGHIVHLEQSDKVIDLMIDFFH